MKLQKVFPLSIILCSAALSLLPTNPARAQTASAQTLHVDSGSTKFLAVGRPSLLKIRGEGKGPTGDLQLENHVLIGELSVDMTSFSTQIEMRDHHMKEKYLEVGKYPKAVLKIKSLSVPELKDLPKDLAFEGDLTLHGVSQPVKGQIHIAKAKADAFAFDAKFTVKITDFKIDIPTYAGIKVADSVDVEVQSEAAPSGTSKSARAPGPAEATKLQQ